VVIDHPFDEAGHSAAEDLARLDRLIEGGLSSRTIVWLPRFLAEDRMREVRRLVILDWLLTGAGERWTSHADHLSEVDRVQARAILESQRNALREGLRRAIQEAYGASPASPGTLIEDPSHDRVLISLDRGFSPAAPVGADLGAAFGNLIDQAYSSTYPGHPNFEPSDVEVSVRDLSAVFAHIERGDGRPRWARAAGRRYRRGPAGEQRVARGHGGWRRTSCSVTTGSARGELSSNEPRADRDWSPMPPLTVADIRGWIDAMQTSLGLAR